MKQIKKPPRLRWLVGGELVGGSWGETVADGVWTKTVRVLGKVGACSSAGRRGALVSVCFGDTFGTMASRALEGVVGVGRVACHNGVASL